MEEDSSQFIPLTKAGRINVHPKLEHLEGKTPFDIWSLLFTQDMVDMITVETQQYAHRDKNDLNFYISSSEISVSLFFCCSLDITLYRQSVITGHLNQIYMSLLSQMK